MLNTKQVGNITEIECMLAFIKLGYNVLTPYGDCERYDFVVDINKTLYRIQVKTSHLSNDGSYIEFKTSNKTTKEGIFVQHAYTKEQIDYFMTFYNNTAYLVPVEESSTSQKRLRFTPPRNNQIQGINFAKDYELERQVKKILER